MFERPNGDLFVSERRRPDRCGPRDDEPFWIRESLVEGRSVVENHSAVNRSQTAVAHEPHESAHSPVDGLAGGRRSYVFSVS